MRYRKYTQIIFRCKPRAAIAKGGGWNLWGQLGQGSFPLSPWDCYGAEHRGRQPGSGLTSAGTFTPCCPHPLADILLEAPEEPHWSSGQPASGLLGSKFTDGNVEAQGLRVWAQRHPAKCRVVGVDGKHPVIQAELKTLGLGSLGFCVETPDMWPVRFEGKVEGREGIPRWGPGGWF